MSKKHKQERVQQKSPAEFFAENQIIAGFDNPGKSLYTSIRELVENSLDAAEVRMRGRRDGMHGQHARAPTHHGRHLPRHTRT